MPDLSGKVALITGAASGSVAATARLFAARGAFVWYADLRRESCDAARAGIAPSATRGAFGASKAAVAQMTRSIAAACATRGLAIRCNAVQPGMAETPMTAAMSDDYRRAWEAQIPARRFARAEEIAEAICFLSSDAASYINGEALLVDGGLINRAVVTGSGAGSA